MTQHVLVISDEVFGIVAGALVLLVFALAVGMHHRSKVLPGSKGHREAVGDSTGAESESIQADGYIDSFANTIEEAGGGMPPVVLVALPGILIWWLVYLILYWQPR